MFSKPPHLFRISRPALVAWGVAAWLSVGFTPSAWAQSAAAARETEEPRSERDSPQSAPETRWYGYEPAIADAVAVGSTFAAVATLCFSLSDDPPPCSPAPSAVFLMTAATAYLAASPAIHVAHGHWGKAGLSLGIRVAPIVLAFAMDGLRGEQGSSNAEGATLIGGAAVAMIVDDALIARETVPSSSTAWYVAPAIDPKQRAASIAVGGLF